MMPFTLQSAKTIDEALAASARGARYIAGGTTLVDLMREEVEQPSELIDINSLALAEVTNEGTTLVIGSLVRMSDCAAHRLTRQMHPLIVESLLEGASPQLRNMATMGGNLLQRVRCPYFRMLDAACNKRQPASGCAAIDGINAGHAVLGTSTHCIATHPSDLAVALVALDATLRLRGPAGERRITVESLYQLPGSTPQVEHTLRPGELILDIRVPAGRYASRARYVKVRDRSSYEFAVVSAAAALDIEAGIVRDARIACGGVGTKPWRMRECEKILAGKPANKEFFMLAARASLAGTKPQSGNGYKLDLLPNTIVRALELAENAE